MLKDGHQAQAVQAKQRRAVALLERTIKQRRAQLQQAEGVLRGAEQLVQQRREHLATLRYEELEVLKRCQKGANVCLSTQDNRGQPPSAAARSSTGGS